MVAVPVNHFSTSPNKGNRLLSDCGSSGGDRCSDSILYNCTADCMVGLWDSLMLSMLENSSRRT